MPAALGLRAPAVPVAGGIRRTYVRTQCVAGPARAPHLLHAAQHAGRAVGETCPLQQSQASVATQTSRKSVIAHASAASVPAEQPKDGWKLPVYIFLWYAFNIVFNLINKSTLNAFPCPWFIGTWQLVASGLFMVFLWITRLHPVPQVDGKFFLALLPVAFFHTVGHISAVVSFSQMAVSFAHIVKSAEPVFSVALSGPLLGVWYPWYVWASLVPIVAGCSLSAMKEVSFAWSGFNNAMISNLGMVLRNILSKKSLNDYKHVDGINLFGLISIASLLYCAPAAFYFESSIWQAKWQAGAAKVGEMAVAQMLLWGGLFYHLYNQLSYMVLDQGISPVTFSVGNTMKRVAVVVSSVMFFRNPVSLLNWAGSFIAIGGTYLYTMATDKHTAEKKAAAAAKKA